MEKLAFKTLGGNGQDIVLIHGFGSDRLSWAANAPALMTVGRVHVVDLPGHGESRAGSGDGSLATISEAVADALSSNGIHRAYLVGHSLGGAVALSLASHQPALALSLILISPLGLGKGVDISFLDSITHATEIESTLETLRRLVVKPQLINKLLAKRLLDQLNKNGVRENLEQIAVSIPVAETIDIPFLLSKIPAAIPKLVMWGDSDAINPLPDSPVEFSSTFVIIEAAGHLPHIERPDLANRLMIDFLKGL